MRAAPALIEWKPPQIGARYPDQNYATNLMPACNPLRWPPAHDLRAVAVRVGDERGRSIGSLQGRRHADRGVHDASVPPVAVNKAHNANRLHDI